jgi:hypothetical protein
MPAIVNALRISRWLLLLAFVAAGLYFLNDAFFSAWVAGGPPGEHKLGWERRSQASLALCIACLLAGVTTFWGARRFPVVGRLTWLLLGIAAVIAVSPFLAQQVLIDKCLDSGGRWSKATIECER